MYYPESHQPKSNNYYKNRDNEKFKDRLERASLLINELFNRHSRLLFIRIDLSYLEKLSKTVTLDDALADVRHLYEDLKWNSELSNGYLGFIRKLEWTPQKGMHHHFLFIYDADVRKADAYVGRLLGEYWVNTITKGRGIYHNCNMNKANYENYVLGRIGRNELEKRAMLLRAIEYLAKVEQVPEDSKGRKLFDMSRL